MPQPRCIHYSPKKTEDKESCANCYKFIGIECLEYLESVEKYQTMWKFAELNRMLGHDAYKRGHSRVRQTRWG